MTAQGAIPPQPLALTIEITEPGEGWRRDWIVRMNGHEILRGETEYSSDGREEVEQQAASSLRKLLEDNQ